MRHPWLKRASGAFVLLLVGLLAAVLPGTAQAGEALKYTVRTSPQDLVFERSAGYDLITLRGEGTLTDVGAPALPARQVRVALPEGLEAIGVRIVARATTQLDGAYRILPAQPPRTRSAEGEIAWIAPDALLYASSEAYPAEQVRLLHQTDLAGQGIAVLEIRPLQFVPSAGRLELATELVLAIETAPGYVCGDYLPAQASARSRERRAAQVREMVLNPEEVGLHSAPASLTGGRALDPGEYEYVIITSLDFEPTLQTLADWKTKKGVPTKMVTTYWLQYESGYTGDLDEMIRAFVIDAYNTWGTEYVLLGGDVNKVPENWYSSTVEPYNVPNDTYYADFDDDWTVEVHVGRASARYTSYLNTFINKVLTYEKNPPASDYAKRALFLGFDLDEQTQGEVLKNDVRGFYFPPGVLGWLYSMVYDSHPGNHEDNATLLMNEGFQFINHVDHCNAGTIGLGSFWHDWEWTGGEVGAFTNGDEQSIFYSTGCWPAAYDQSTCVGEAFVQNAGGGGLVFVGNSRYGWYNPGLLTTLSNRYDREFWEALFLDEQFHIGQAFSQHKNSFYPNSDTYKYIFTELTLLGDPELLIWMDDPQALVVTHPAELPVGSASFTVHVEEAGGTPVADARVCLWKDGDVYQREWTGPGGDAVFSPQPTSQGALYVTATKQNYYPRETEALVTEGGAAVDDPLAAVARFRLLPARPSPFSRETTLRYELPAPAAVTLQVFDPTGRLVRSLVPGLQQSAGSHGVIWDGRDTAGEPVASGVYLYRLDAGTQRAQQRLLRLR